MKLTFQQANNSVFFIILFFLGFIKFVKKRDGSLNESWTREENLREQSMNL